MKERFGFCGDCKNKDMCHQCYRGSYYEKATQKEKPLLRAAFKASPLRRLYLQRVWQ